MANLLYYGLVRSTTYVLIRVMRPGNLLVLRGFEAHRVALRIIAPRSLGDVVSVIVLSFNSCKTLNF